MTSSLFKSEFCEIKKKYDTAKERLETDVKDITELIQEREGAYTDYQDASALKYSHVQATARLASPLRNILFLYFIYFKFLIFCFSEMWLKKTKKKMGYSACSGFSF